MKVYKISAVTLLIRDMKRSCIFYSKIPGLKKVYGGSEDSFTSYEIGENSSVYLNLELSKLSNSDEHRDSKNLSRIILHTDDVDKLYTYFKNDQIISHLISFENEPSNASWGTILPHTGFRWTYSFICSTVKVIETIGVVGSC